MVRLDLNAKLYCPKEMFPDMFIAHDKLKPQTSSSINSLVFIKSIISNQCHLISWSVMNSLTIIISLLSFFFFQPTHAQSSPQDYLNSHNAAQNQVGVANVTWDNTVAAYAQSYANQRVGDCSLVHSNGPYGENLAKGTGTFTGTYAVSLWVTEKQYYDYKTNNCASGRDCLHYTQIVWRESVRIGCARVQCNNGWWYVVCNYDPPGNYVGELPY